MKKIYKFFWDCGRMGSVESIFIADDTKVEKAIGKDVYFGEILGKHSEIYGTLGEEDLQVLTDDQNFIAQFEEILGDGFSIGYNPLHYLSGN